MSEVDPCWLVIHYRTYQERWLRAICTTRENAEARKSMVSKCIDEESEGCKRGDQVVVEQTQLDHLFGHGMMF